MQVDFKDTDWETWMPDKQGAWWLVPIFRRLPSVFVWRLRVKGAGWSHDPSSQLNYCKTEKGKCRVSR